VSKDMWTDRVRMSMNVRRCPQVSLVAQALLRLSEESRVSVGTWANGLNRTYIPFRTVIDLHGMKANRVLRLPGALLCIFVVAGPARGAGAAGAAAAPTPGPPAASSRAAAHADAGSRAQAVTDAYFSEVS